MKILIIGSGGREHSIALACKDHDLYIAPGNAGTKNCGQNVAIRDTDSQGLLAFAQKENIDLTIVGPEAPLVQGIVDLFRQHDLAIIGPDKKGAQLEGSKRWAKEFMKRHQIPTADYATFTDFSSAKAYIQAHDFPLVIKADGLAAGKGVTVAHNQDEALAALEDCLLDNKFKEAGKEVVIEAFLTGEEASIFAFTDGKTILPMQAAQDHKAIFDGDKGPNTGGMGAYCPAPIVTNAVYQRVIDRVFTPFLSGLKQEGIDYRGIIYAGLMIDEGNPSIVEFNVRFGDPETQVVLPRLKTDLVSIFQAIHEQRLSDIHLEWDDCYAVCVVLASAGYPGNYETGKVISGLTERESVHVVHAGTKVNENGDIVTNGGRVLGVVGMNADLQKAIDFTYKEVSAIHFEGKYNRSDIAKKAF